MRNIRAPLFRIQTSRYAPFSGASPHSCAMPSISIASVDFGPWSTRQPTPPPASLAPLPLRRILSPRAFGQAAFAVAGVAEGEIEYLAEHPGLTFQVPFGPGVARHGYAAAAFARIFYPRSATFCHARRMARFGSASEASDSETEMVRNAPGAAAIGAHLSTTERSGNALLTWPALGWGDAAFP